MSWINLLNQEELVPIPKEAELVSDNGVSVVWRGNNGWYYKRSIPYLIENEYWFLAHMYNSGFVPQFERHDKYTIKIKEIVRVAIDSELRFRENCDRVLFALERNKIRHGDLTEPHIIVGRADHPWIIDWAEARWSSDPAPDKRPEGDKYWMEITMNKILGRK